MAGMIHVLKWQKAAHPDASALNASRYFGPPAIGHLRQSSPLQLYL